MRLYACLLFRITFEPLKKLNIRIYYYYFLPANIGQVAHILQQPESEVLTKDVMIYAVGTWIVM